MGWDTTGLTFGTQVHAAVVHVVGDALAIDDAEVDHVLLEHLDVGGEIEAPAHFRALGLVAGSADGFVADGAEDAGDLHVAPIVVIAVVSREVRRFFVGLESEAEDWLKRADKAGIDIVAGLFDRHRKSARARLEGVADLRVANEHHAGRSPVVDRVGEDVAVHEGGVGLSAEDRSPLAVAWRRRIVVCPASSPTPYRSNSNLTNKSCPPMSWRACTPNRLCRALRIAWPSPPNWSSLVGIFEGRSVASQSGIDAVEILDVVNLAQSRRHQMLVRSARRPRRSRRQQEQTPS